MGMIYADNAATTRLSDAALEATLPYLREEYGNASTLYKLGRGAHKTIEDARSVFARGINAMPAASRSADTARGLRTLLISSARRISQRLYLSTKTRPCALHRYATGYRRSC